MSYSPSAAMGNWENLKLSPIIFVQELSFHSAR